MADMQHCEHVDGGSQDPVLRRQLNKDTRINLASAGLFTASDYLQVCSCDVLRRKTTTAPARRENLRQDAHEH